MLQVLSLKCLYVLHRWCMCSHTADNAAQSGTDKSLKTGTMQSKMCFPVGNLSKVIFLQQSFGQVPNRKARVICCSRSIIWMQEWSVSCMALKDNCLQHVSAPDNPYQNRKLSTWYVAAEYGSCFLGTGNVLNIAMAFGFSIFVLVYCAASFSGA